MGHKCKQRELTVMLVMDDDEDVLGDDFAASSEDVDGTGLDSQSPISVSYFCGRLCYSDSSFCFMYPRPILDARTLFWHLDTSF